MLNLINYSIINVSEISTQKYSTFSIVAHAEETPSGQRECSAVVAHISSMQCSGWFRERVTGSWRTQILNETKKCKKCQLGEVLVGEVSVEGTANWGKCHFGEVPIEGSASWGTKI